MSSGPILGKSDVTRVLARRKSAVASTSLEQDLATARFLATMLDSRFEVAGVRFGLDAVLGLLPVLGDGLSFAIGMYPVFLARKHRLGKRVIFRMMANLGIDFLVGSVPVVGDVADLAFKAHRRNFQLLESALARRAGR